MPDATGLANLLTQSCQMLPKGQSMHKVLQFVFLDKYLFTQSILIANKATSYLINNTSLQKTN